MIDDLVVFQFVFIVFLRWLIGFSAKLRFILGVSFFVVDALQNNQSRSAHIMFIFPR